MEQFDLIAAQTLLHEMTRHSVEQGRLLLLRNRVYSIEVTKDECSATGSIKDDNGTVEVQLTYLNGRWSGECSRDGYPAGCQHVSALLQTLISEYHAQQVRRLSSMHTGQEALAKQRAITNQESGSELASRLVGALGRALKPQEAAYLRAIQKVHKRFLANRGLTSWDCQELGFVFSSGRIGTWPKTPQTEHEFWLYLAYAARKADLPIPPFMEPITDLSEVETRMAEWERQKRVEEWGEKLKQAEMSYSDGQPERGSTDLRLLIDSHELRLQIKEPGEHDFTPLRKTRYREMQFARSSFPWLTPEGSLIWSTMSQHMGYEAFADWKHASHDLNRDLGRLLAHPQLRNHVVTWQGLPFERCETPLRWELTPAQTEEEDYQIRLVLPDGSSPPPILAILPGRPTLYLTPQAVYPGPKNAGLQSDDSLSFRVPARALETPEGVSLLQHLGLEVPDRLKSKIRMVLLQPVVQCSLASIYEGSKTEDCLFTVTAHAEDGAEFGWGLHGWYPITRRGRVQNGAIVSYDQSRLGLIPALMAPLELKPNFGTLRVRVNKTFPERFAAWLKTVPAEVEVRLSGELASFAEQSVAGHVRLEVKETVIDWFDLSVLVDVSDTTLTPAEIKLLLNAKGGYVRLAGKGWKRLQFDLSQEEDERLAHLGLSPRELSAEPQRLHTLQLANSAAEKFLPAQQFAEVHRRAAEIKARVTPGIPKGISAEFRSYQLEGYHFLAYLSANHFGGVLADDMGLGKTVQTLAWVLHLREQKGGARSASPHVLVVCPKSVMDNWQAEAQKFSPELRVRVWPAPELARLKTELDSADIHVINYNQLRALGESLASINWMAVILDEGQYIKNPSSQTAQIARSLRSENRLILTGTPIENRLMDLWSLMSFAMPGVLGSRAQFGRIYDSKTDPLARQRLSARVRPFLLRRTKTQVAKDLPDRIEEDLFCEMEGEQLALYRAELKRAQQRLLNIATQKELAEQQFHLLTSLLRLRQICCHPKLINPESKSESAKIEALLEQLQPIMEEGQKVLIFSQFVELLKLVQTAVREREWPSFYLAGETENRGELVKEFQAAEGAAVFLISLKAGGFGLNLTAASYVVLFDPWWNPAVENQAIDRTHRIGQVNKVIAYRLLIKNSIEEKIRALQRTKRALSEEVLGEERFAKNLTLDDLRFLLAD
jgi:hypothetical protein